MQQAIDVRDVQVFWRELGVSFGRGEYLVRQGDSGRGLFVVLKGRAVLTRGRSEGPGNQILRVAGAGEAFGEVAALAEVPYDISARALEPVEALHVPRAQLLDLFRVSPRLALNITLGLAEQIMAAMPVEAMLEDEALLEAPVSIALADPEPAAPVQRPERAARPLDPFAIAPSLRTGPPPDPEAERPAAAAPTPEPTRLSAYYTQEAPCPICATTFGAMHVRTSALKIRRRDSDLRVEYEGANPVHYAAYVCPNCQYAAFEDDWSTLTPEEHQRLQADMDARRVAALDVDFSGERSLDAVMIGYLLALRCYDLRAPEPRRRAAVLHRLAWTARETGNASLEREYLELARVDYLKAFQKDDRLTEGGAVTLSYLLGDLALRVGRVHEALRWFENTLRMEQAKRHPEIQRLTRDRWADARQAQRASA